MTSKTLILHLFSVAKIGSESSICPNGLVSLLTPSGGNAGICSMSWLGLLMILGHCEINNNHRNDTYCFIKMVWNNLGFEIIFSCQENLAFQKVKKTFLCC